MASVRSPLEANDSATTTSTATSPTLINDNDNNNNNGPTVGTDRVILVFDYRTLIEAEDVDVINFEAWREVLEAFGYGELTFDHFMRSLVFKSPSEVMTALCPYTTRAEWTPLLNKRAVRLNKDVTRLCYTEMLPIAGVKDFILDCAKQSLVTCLFLSPFPDDVTRRMLEIAEVGGFIDLIHSYTDREFALLEALEMINIRPSRIPDGIEHRWSDDHHRMVLDEEGRLVKATTGSDEVSRSEGILNPAQIVVMASDVEGCKAASQLGCKVIGVTYNGGYYGIERDSGSASPTAIQAATSSSSAHHNNHSHGAVAEPPQALINGLPSPTRSAASSSSAQSPSHPHHHSHGTFADPTDEYDRANHEEALLAAGAATIVSDYSQLKYIYLRHLRN